MLLSAPCFTFQEELAEARAAQARAAEQQQQAVAAAEAAKEEAAARQATERRTAEECGMLRRALDQVLMGGLVGQ